MRIFKLSCVILGALALALTQNALAQDSYPSKPIRMMVPWAAGNLTDSLGRKLADELSKVLPQPVWVENKGGASGIIGMEALKMAKPDGYTIGIGAIGPLALNPGLYKKKLPYDPIIGFTPISMLWSGPMVILVPAQSSIKSLKQLIETSTANSSEINYATPGNGTLQHITAEYLKDEAKANWTHIPYQGSGQATVAALGGQVDVLVETLSVALPHIKSGKLRPLAVSTQERSDLVPDVPTIAESGYPKVVTDGWICLIGPKGMPVAMRQTLNEKVAVILHKPEFQSWVSSQGGRVLGSTPDELGEYIQKEVHRLGAIIRDMEIQF